jgi:PTH1 family peptidyl-tRNA hydrolase
MKLIVGLGNPGPKYKNTRHNVGFLILDELQRTLSEANFSNWRENQKFQAEICEGTLNGKKIILAKPLTFMNNSGRAVQALLTFYKIEPTELIVVHDDADIAFNEFKIQTGRGSAGHRGVESIVNTVGANDFTRLRVGVGRSNRPKAEDFILKNFSLIEKIRLNLFKQKILDAILKIL